MRYLVSIMLLFVSATSFGQGMSSSAQGNIKVYSIQSITVDRLQGAISFNSPNDYFNGVTVESYANIKVKSNENWLLYFSAQSAYFTPLSSNASKDMPSSVLGIKVSNKRSYTPLTTGGDKLQQGNRGSNGSKHDFDIDVHLDPGFAYNGGLYNIGVVFTLTKQ